MSTTYVTALYNLRKREGQDNVDSDHFSSINAYLKASKRLLETPDPFVIFCEPDLEPPLRAIRGDRPTIFRDIKFEHLPFWDKLPRIVENNKTNPVVWVSPEKFTDLYYLIINHKVEFVRQVADLNTFNTEWFAWVDMRIVLPESGLANLSQWWDPERTNVAMMGLIDRNRPKDRYSFFRNNHGWVAGGFFAGKRAAILDFTTTVIREWTRTLDEGYSPSDETMFGYMAATYPDMVTAVAFGEYGDLIYNQAAVCRTQHRAYNIQEFALVGGDLRASIQAGEGLRRAYLTGVLPPMADHEHFHIFYRLMVAYEQTGQTELAAARKAEVLRPELREMLTRFHPHLLPPCDHGV
jgi:hypothetical protein